MQKVKLTKREVEIMNLLSEGLQSKKIAEALYISKRTVDFHLANIFDKLNATNRVLALKRFAELQTA